MQPRITLPVENVDLDMLEKVLQLLGANEDHTKFVLDNYQPDFKGVIERFLNKEITFKELRQAVK